MKSKGIASRIRTPHKVGILAWGLVLLVASPAAAQPLIRVPTDQATLQAAISAVPNGGVIEMANGVYSAPSGGFVLNDLAKAFTIRAASGATVALDGTSTTGVVRFVNSSVGAGKMVTFESLTFRNGYSSLDAIAGGVTLMRAKAMFRGCRFESNATIAANTGGGAVEVAETSEAFFVDCFFTGNSAYFYGGALAVETGSRAWIHRGQFVGNRTNLPNHHLYAAGGAIHVGNSTLRVSNSRFDSNLAGYVGGAIYAIGTWVDPVATPSADVVLSNCTFVNNRAVRDATVPSAGKPPTEGGAIHLEDQTTARVFNSRFFTNSADTGGAMNLYRAIVTAKGCLFQGNRAVGIGSGNGFGGAISVISNDSADATTGNGSINRRPSSLTLIDSVIQGRFGSVTSVAQMAGGIYAAGDANSLYGQNGMPQNGTAAENRAAVQLTNVAIYDCEVVGNTPSGDPGTGAGGGIFADLASVTATDLLLGRSIAGQSSGIGAGGGVVAINQSSISFTNPFVAASVARAVGAGFYLVGSQIVISGGSVVENQLVTAGGAAGIFSAPDNVSMTGTVTSALFSGNNGFPIYDSDQTSGTFNDVKYNGNSIYSTFGAQVYVDSLVGAWTVAQLNSLTVTRTLPTPNTKKSTSPNTSLASAPSAGVLKTLPPLVLAKGAAGDPAGPTTSYLVYGWSPGSAQLDGATVTGFAGMTAASGPGSHSLWVGSSMFPATVLAGALPMASLLPAPASVLPGGSSTLTWSATAGTFVDSALDQGIGYLSTASGTTNVTPPETTKYTFFQISEEGGAATMAVVFVNRGPGSLGPPVITAPTAGQVLAVAGVTCSWNAVGGATGYGVQVWDSGNGATVFTGSLAGNGSTSQLLTLPDGTYLLGVRACGGGLFTEAACGAYATRSFSVSAIQPPAGPFRYHIVTPCRILDTRTSSPALDAGDPILSANQERTFDSTFMTRCGIPADAKVLSVNVTAVSPAATGWLSLYAGGLVRPGTSTISFTAGRVRANNAIVSLGVADSLTVLNVSSGTVHFVLDVNGYFN